MNVSKNTQSTISPFPSMNAHRQNEKVVRYSILLPGKLLYLATFDSLLVIKDWKIFYLDAGSVTLLVLLYY